MDWGGEACAGYAAANVGLIHAAEPTAELAHAPDGALIAVMTHAHAIDLEIVAEALRAERFGYVGLIGSAPKRARFFTHIRAAGVSEAPHSMVTCPIRGEGWTGEPARGSPPPARDKYPKKLLRGGPPRGAAGCGETLGRPPLVGARQRGEEFPEPAVLVRHVPDETGVGSDRHDLRAVAHD